MPDIVNNLYDDASNLGKFQSWIGLIIAIAIGVVLIIVGFFYVTSSNQYVQTTGIVKNINCQDVVQTNSKNTTTTKTCTLNVEYNINGNTYTNTLTLNNTVYSINQQIQIEYLKSDPNQIRTPGLADSTMGFISSGISIIIILGAGFNYYMTSNYKLYASAQGANTVYNVFK